MSPRLTDLLRRLTEAEAIEDQARAWALAGGRGPLPDQHGTTCRLVQEWCWRAGLLADREDLSEDDQADCWGRIDTALESVAQARHWVHLGVRPEAELLAPSRTGAVVAPIASEILASRSGNGANHGGR